MKKIWFILMVLASIISITACNSSSGGDEGGDDSGYIGASGNSHNMDDNLATLKGRNFTCLEYTREVEYDESVWTSGGGSSDGQPKKLGCAYSNCEYYTGTSDSQVTKYTWEPTLSRYVSTPLTYSISGTSISFSDGTAAEIHCFNFTFPESESEVGGVKTIISDKTFSDDDNTPSRGSVNQYLNEVY